MKNHRLLSALCVLFPALAWSNPVHSVWSNSPMFVADPVGGFQTATKANCAFSWTEGTGYAFANATATSSTGDVFEFQFLAPTASAANGAIVGNWNVTKNGVLVCGNCSGSAYGLSGGVGTGFKIYVSGESYHLSGYVSSVYNY
jgi:hypothetical protein